MLGIAIRKCHFYTNLYGLPIFDTETMLYSPYPFGAHRHSHTHKHMGKNASSQSIFHWNRIQTVIDLSTVCMGLLLIRISVSIPLCHLNLSLPYLIDNLINPSRLFSLLTAGKWHQTLPRCTRQTARRSEKFATNADIWFFFFFFFSFLIWYDQKIIGKE